jgi:hypothetical protein
MKRKTLSAAIKLCLAEMDGKIGKGLITTAKEADELAAELTGEHFPDPDSDGHEALLAILCRHAGEAFPGNWEDYPRK